MSDRKSVSSTHILFRITLMPRARATMARLNLAFPRWFSAVVVMNRNRTAAQLTETGTRDI